MNSKFKTVWLLAVCMCLMSGPLAIAAESEKQGSVLSRLQAIEDDELGQLIRIALDNLPETKALKNPPYKDKPTREEKEQLKFELLKAEETAKSKAIRGVTEVYSQIKLLDTQIEHTEEKINSLKKNSAIRIELILARAELVARRTTKLAELREIMNIVPKHAFWRKPVTDLNSWFKLDVIDDYVYILKCLKPYSFSTSYSSFYRYGRYSKIDPVKCMSEEDAIRYVHELIKKQDQLPLRVDISRNAAGSKLSEQIHERIIKIVKNENMQYEVEVYLNEYARSRVNKRDWFLKDGKIYDTLDDLKRDRPDNRKFFEPYNSEYFKKVGLLPVKYKIEYDAEGKDLAFRTKEVLKETAKKYGVTQFVEIELREFDPNALSD